MGVTFVLLCPRRGEEVLAAEYDDFLHFTGLTAQELEQRPLDTPDSELGDFQHVEGVFIGGSPFTITAPIEPLWQDAISAKLAAFATRQSTAADGIPVFSTCYGASMFAHYLGGEVSQRYSESPGVSLATPTPAAVEDAIAKVLPEHFHVMTGHKDSVEQLPLNATLLATGESCPAQLYRIGDRVWVSQFHPEMDGERMTTRLSFYEDDGYVTREQLEATYAGLRGHDTTAANGLLRRFVEYCRGEADGASDCVDVAAGGAATAGATYASSTISM